MARMADDGLDPLVGLDLEMAIEEALNSQRVPYAPPRPDPWDDYALEKVRAQLIDDEFYFADQNRGFTLWGVISACSIIFTVTKASLDTKPASTWDITFVFFAAFLFLICATLRIYGKIQKDRIESRLKWLDRNGLKYL